MRTLIILISTLSIVSSMKIYSQVSISPEIGLNFRPYILKNLDSEFYHNKPELYVGFMGEVFFNSNISLQSRLGYIFRKHTTVSHHITFNHLYLGTKFMNREISVDLDLIYSFSNGIKIGSGLGFISKINSYILEDYTTEKYYYKIQDNTLYSMNILIAYQYRKFELNARYFYLFNTELNGPDFVMLQDGHHGLSCGISYRLFSSKKK
jgi:hypothetical protein